MAYKRSINFLLKSFQCLFFFRVFSFDWKSDAQLVLLGQLVRLFWLNQHVRLVRLDRLVWLVQLVWLVRLVWLARFIQPVWLICLPWFIQIVWLDWHLSDLSSSGLTCLTCLIYLIKIKNILFQAFDCGCHCKFVH